MAEIAPDDPNVLAIVKLEKELQILVSDPKAFEILKLKEDLDTRIKEGLTKLQGMMELSHTKKLIGEWGYITLVHTTRFNVIESQLPEEFFKRVPDTRKIGDNYKLKNTVPPGVTPMITTSLRKKIN